ncbi:MAG: tetratricopeptide repeat protein [Bacteroidota bacterium]|nr:tetratricopeptide repeat protein [Bacteroidota bacterium]
MPKVLAMYAATAFIVMEAAEIMLPRLGLPDWSVTLVIILLIVGLPVAFVLSWIFDITPQGVVKTAPVEDAEQSGEPEVTQRRKLRISDLVIGILLIAVMVLAYPKIFNQGNSRIPREIRGKISLAVMPFKNVTGDTIYNLWQEGMQNLMITALSNSTELAVRQFETMNSAITAKTDVNFASFTPSMIGQLAKQLDANTVVSGGLYKSGNKIRITANIMNADTEEIYRSYELDGNTEDDFFMLADSISMNIRNFLEIKSMSKVNLFDTGDVFTQSSNAYKLYIQGLSYHQRLDYTRAAEHYNKAIQIDSNFVSAMLKLAFCYGDMQQGKLSKLWAYEAYERIDQLPPDMQILVNAVKASVDKKPLDQLNYCRQYLLLDPHSIYMTYMTAWINFNLENWHEAIEDFEKSLNMLKRFDTHPWSWTYILLGRAYHFTGQHKKEEKTFETGREYWPEQSATFAYWQAICAVTLEDSVYAQTFLDEIKAMIEKRGWPEANLNLWYAGVYTWAESWEKAEEYYRKAMSLSPGNEFTMFEVAQFLITNDIHVEEGMEMLAPLVEKYPENAFFLYAYGVGLYKMERPQEAIKALESSWEMRSYYDHKHFTLKKEVYDLLDRS